MQKKKFLPCRVELKEHFHKGPGQCWSEGRCPTIWTLRWDTDATTSQGKHKPFEKIKQVLLSSTGTEVLNYKYYIFKAFTPTRSLNAWSSYVLLALNVPGKHGTQQLFSSWESGQWWEDKNYLLTSKRFNLCYTFVSANNLLHMPFSSITIGLGWPLCRSCRDYCSDLIAISWHSLLNLNFQTKCGSLGLVKITMTSRRESSRGSLARVIRKASVGAIFTL